MEKKIWEMREVTWWNFKKLKFVEREKKLMEILPAGSHILHFAGFNLWFRLVLILQLTSEKEQDISRGQRVRGNNNRTKRVDVWVGIHIIRPSDSQPNLYRQVINDSTWTTRMDYLTLNRATGFRTFRTIIFFLCRHLAQYMGNIIVAGRYASTVEERLECQLISRNDNYLP